MTIAEKILAAHAGKGEVKPGEYIWCNVDGTAILGHSALLKRLEALGVERLFDPERIYAVEDHMAPPPTIEVANAMSDLRKLVKKYGITHFFEYGRHGPVVDAQAFADSTDGEYIVDECVVRREVRAAPAVDGLLGIAD